MAGSVNRARAVACTSFPQGLKQSERAWGDSQQAKMVAVGRGGGRASEERLENQPAACG